MSKKSSEWKFSSLGPRTRTETEKIDDGVYEGAVVRTIKERAIIGLPAELAEDPDADEIEKLIAEYSGRVQPSEDQSPSETRRTSAVILENEVNAERDEAVREIREQVTRKVHQFEAARLRLHHLLHKTSDEPKVEIKELEPPECERCRDLEVLVEENKWLKQKLAECQKDTKEEFSCKCQIKQKVEKLKQEERALLETISLKLERLDALKAQDHEAELCTEQTKIKLCTRLSEQHKIDNVFHAAEEAFHFKCKQIRELQEESKRFDQKAKKLREEARAAAARLSEAEKQVKSLHSQLTKLQAECRVKEETVLKQRRTMVQLDDTAVKLRSEIKNLKEELQMLAESLKFHRREVEERNKEAQALNLDEQRAQKQLDEQRKVTETQKQAVATEMERSRALEFVAENCLQEAEDMSKALKRLRLSKKTVGAELQELKRQIGCKEAEIESEVDRLETLKQTQQNLSEGRNNAGEILLQQVRRDRAKIKAQLDEIEALGALLCEAIYIRSLVERDNNALEDALEHSTCAEDKTQEVSDLEQQIDKHKQLIAALGEKVDAFEVSHQTWGKDADEDEEEERVVRLTYQRVSTVNDLAE